MFHEEENEMRRGTMFCLAIVAAMTLIVSGASAQEFKLGYIDSERIFNEYRAVGEAQQQFDRDVEAWKKEAEQSERELQSMQEELESQRLLLSETALQEKENQLQTMAAEYERFIQSVWGPTGKIAQRNAELTRPIMEKVREVVDKLAAEQGFSLIFDAADGNLVYGEKSLDLTDQVLTELNKDVEP
jgi:outer membrane protein